MNLKKLGEGILGIVGAAFMAFFVFMIFQWDRDHDHELSRRARPWVAEYAPSLLAYLPADTAFPDELRHLGHVVPRAGTPPPIISPSPPLISPTAVAQVGCGVMSKPSPNEVKTAIIAFWDNQRESQIAYAKQSLAANQPSAPLESAGKDCSNAGYDCVRYPGGPVAQERCRQSIVQSCLQERERNMSAERQSRSYGLESAIDQYKRAMSAPTGQQQAEGLSFCVSRPINLEGNVKSYVDMRPNGDDRFSEFKASLQCRDGRWVVTDLQQAGTFLVTPDHPWCS